MDAEKLQLIEELTANVDAVQDRVLAEILGRNAEAEYLLRCGLAGATDRATFRAKVPLVTYEDLRPYIRRIADGDRSPVLTGPEHPVTEFLISTGTSGGESKMVPIVEDESHRRYQPGSLAAAVMKQYVPGLDMGTALLLQFVRSETKTPGGLPARPALTSYYLSDLFQNRPRNACTSPTAAVLCTDVFQSMYAQMLCGLCLRHDVLRFGAVFASAVVRAIRFLQLNWEDLAADIEAGTLTQRVTEQSVCEAVAGIHRTDPELARVIRLECSKGDWASIITRIWPGNKYLDAISTGSMAQYVPTLNHYSGGLPIVSTIYGSSETAMGVNLRPLCDPSEVSYTILPNMAYFEFLPLDAGDEAPKSQQLVELARVEAGREYELVVTTYTGLCRYRVGDVLRVTGFHNAAPQFRFVRRQNELLSVDLDKTDEAELQRAVERASDLLRQHGAAVADYTSRVCTNSFPGHYVIYWEVVVDQPEAVSVDGGLLHRCCLEMEEALSSMYRQIRVAEGSIGPLEIRVVQPGTFEELESYAVSRGASIGQYKVPRCVAAEGIVQLLDSRVVSSHSSTALPHWEPDQLFNDDATPPDQ